MTGDSGGDTVPDARAPDQDAGQAAAPGHPTPAAAFAQDPDAPLVARACRGDMRAFEMLVVKHQRRVERLIGRMVRDADLVPDLAQETFIRAYRALPQFRGASAFYTWLYRIAVNTTRRALAAQRRDPVVVRPGTGRAGDDPDTEPSGPETALSDEATPEAVLASKEIAMELRAAVAALPEDLRQALTLREVEGLSYDEIADVMQCPVGTVRSRIFRAREAVAARLRPLIDPGSRARW